MCEKRKAGKHDIVWSKIIMHKKKRRFFFENKSVLYMYPPMPLVLWSG